MMIVAIAAVLSGIQRLHFRRPATQIAPARPLAA
jgi:hypothetical protein